MLSWRSALHTTLFRNMSISIPYGKFLRGTFTSLKTHIIRQFSTNFLWPHKLCWLRYLTSADVFYWAETPWEPYASQNFSKRELEIRAQTAYYKLADFFWKTLESQRWKHYTGFIFLLIRVVRDLSLNCEDPHRYVRCTSYRTVYIEWNPRREHLQSNTLLQCVIASSQVLLT